MYKGVFRTLSNIYDDTLLKIGHGLLQVNPISRFSREVVDFARILQVFTRFKNELCCKLQNEEKVVNIQENANDVIDSQYEISFKHFTGSFILTDKNIILCKFQVPDGANFLRFDEGMSKICANSRGKFEDVKLTHEACHRYLFNYWILNAAKFREYCQ